ncbi:MAG: flavodoxin family protein [archaeon]
MKALVVFKSYHHGNTKKVAEAIAPVLNAKLLGLDGAKASDLNGFDLIGFGSGIYAFNVHGSLLKFIESLQMQNGKKCFVFSTSGSGNPGQHKKAVEALKAKGFEILGEFSCKGFDTFGPFKLMGGMAKGHPDHEDLENAKSFAERLKD